jgi:hypothetical protein
VNPALAGVALAVVFGALIAGSARNARTALFGLLLALLGAAFIADPLPDTLGLAGRLVGAVLGGYLLWIAGRGTDTRTDPRTGGSRLGWPAEVLIAAAAATVGFGSHGLGAPATGPAAAQAAGFAIAALAIAPILNGRDTLRIGIGLNILVVGAILVRTGLGGTPEALEQLVVAGLLAMLGGAVAALTIASRTEGVTGFDLELAPTERARRPPDAHPIDLR